jgi:hypothetical protein
MTASWTNNIIGPWTAWAAIHLLCLKCKINAMCASVLKIYLDGLILICWIVIETFSFDSDVLSWYASPLLDRCDS